VIRAGFGMFYQPFDIADVLTAERYNGIVQRQFVVTNPDFFPLVPSASSLTSSRSPQTTERLSPHLRAPYLRESAVALKRPPHAHTTVLFGLANQPYGAGSFCGTGFSESADNRRLEFQTRFTFGFDWSCWARREALLSLCAG
jgi:hypothetical protein